MFLFSPYVQHCQLFSSMGILAWGTIISKDEWYLASTRCWNCVLWFCFAVHVHQSTKEQRYTSTSTLTMLHLIVKNFFMYWYYYCECYDSYRCNKILFQISVKESSNWLQNSFPHTFIRHFGSLHYHGNAHPCLRIWHWLRQLPTSIHVTWIIKDLWRF